MADHISAEQAAKISDAAARMELDQHEEVAPEEEEEEEEEEEATDPGFQDVLDTMEGSIEALHAPLGEHMGPLEAAYNDLFATIASKTKVLEAEEADVSVKMGEMKANFDAFKENMRELLGMGPSQGAP